MAAKGDLVNSVQRQRSFHRMLWVGLWIVNLLVAGTVVLIIERNRESEVLQAEALTENFAKILEETLVGFISKIDITLLSVREQMDRQPGAAWLDDVSLDDYLAQQDRHIPEALGLRVVDEYGVIRFAANGVKVPHANVADTASFIRLKADPEAGLLISSPMIGRATPRWLVTLGRRLNHPDGRFAGDVHAAVAVERFIEMFSRLDLGEHGNVGLWNQTTLVARYARDDKAGATVGATTPSNDLKRLLGSGLRAAHYHTRSGVDGVSRVFHFRQVAGYPLYLVVGLADEDYLAQWRHDSLRLAILALLFILSTVVFAALLSRFWKRQEADHQAMLAQEKTYMAGLEASNRVAEAARQQSEQILASAAEGICGVDLGGKIIFVNPVARRMFGWADDEGVGLDLHAATHHHDAEGQPSPAETCPVNLTLADGARRHVPESLYWRKDGSAFPVEYTVSPIVQAGKIAGAVNVFRDISERKQIEMELARHRQDLEALVRQRTTELTRTEARASHILESSADGLYGIDRRGMITFANPAACALLGYPEAQLVGQSAHRLFHHSHPDGASYPPGECPSYEALKLGNKVRVDDEVYWHADGHAIPVMYATHPMIQDGEIVGAVTSFVDVSVQRAAAEAKEKALVAAENLARVRREFLANMSHEIRTPLNGVLGFAEIGQRHAADPNRARESFEKIRRSGKRLLGVINDILDFSKIEAGKLQIEQTETVLAEVVGHAVDLVRERAMAKQLDLQVHLAADLPSACLSDPLRMGQVLLNILSNAVKFTERGRVVLSVGQQGDQLVFRIVDTGIGMDDEQLGQLFNPFQQADASATRKFGGSGLGLAISKRIIGLMGGDIRVESHPGLGTTVEFRLPSLSVPGQAAPERAVTTRVEQPSRPLAGYSILLADDEAINRLVLEDYLREAGARVVLVADGGEAVERIRTDGPGAFDIVLMDIQMPQMDGYEATRLIRQLAPDLPIVAQTAHAFNQEREKCLAAGMLGHLSKPVDADEMIRVIQQFARCD